MFFNTSSGCIKQVIPGSAGHYYVEGWPSSTHGGTDVSALVVIDAIMPVQQDIAIPVVAADDYHVLYSFGKNFGGVRVVGTAYLGMPSQSAAQQVMSQMQQAYDRIRLSQALAPVTIRITQGFACKAFFISFKIGQSDPDFHKLEWELQGLLAPDPQGTK